MSDAKEPSEAAMKPCTCGSGQHPRVCAKHPLGYAAHIARLDLESYMESSMAADVVWNKWWLAHVADMQQRIDTAVQAETKKWRECFWKDVYGHWAVNMTNACLLLPPEHTKPTGDVRDCECFQFAWVNCPPDPMRHHPLCTKTPTPGERCELCTKERLCVEHYRETILDVPAPKPRIP